MIFTIYANHQAFVLTKTAAMFSRFGVNIEDWHMSANKQKPTMSHKIQVCCEVETAKRIQKQLQRMVDVYQVDVIDAGTDDQQWHLPDPAIQSQKQLTTATTN